MVEAEVEPNLDRRRRWLKFGKLALRCLVFLLLVIGIGHSVQHALGKFREQQFSLAKLNFGWLAAAGGLYLIACLPSWVYWHQALCAMGAKPTWYRSLRAFFIGHLGKYSPGKGLVVVIRAALVSSETVSKTIAALGVFIETLTAMAVGAVLGALYIAVAFREQRVWLWGAILCACVAGVPILPPIFRRVVRLLRVNRLNQEVDQALHGLNFPLVISGAVTLAGGWVLMGLSLWCVLQSLPAPPTQLANVSAVLPQLTAVVSLAVVVGFVSMLPGGLGAREFVVMTIVTPAYGEVAGIASAFLLRFVWLLAEVAISIILYLVRPR